MEKVLVFVDEQRYEEALQEISLIKRNNPNPMLFMMEAVANMELGRYENAETSALIAFRMNPCVESYNILINLYIRSDKLQEALKLADKTIKRFKQVDHYRIKTQILLRLNNPKAAIKNIFKTLKFEPRDAIHYYDLASCYSLLSNYRNALKYIDIAITLNPAPEFYQLKNMFTQLLSGQR